MPRVVFSDDLEKKLIELWRETSPSVDVDNVLLLREKQARYNCFYFSQELKISNKGSSVFFEKLKNPSSGRKGVGGQERWRNLIF